jgi:hypothetical protein
MQIYQGMLGFPLLKVVSPQNNWAMIFHPKKYFGFTPWKPVFFGTIFRCLPHQMRSHGKKSASSYQM